MKNIAEIIGLEKMEHEVLEESKSYKRGFNEAVQLASEYVMDEVQLRLQERIEKLEQEQTFWINVIRANSKLTDDLIYRPQWKKEIMPSCLIKI